MIEDLIWLGIFWKPPMISQSGRTELYSAFFDRLLHQGDVYPCHCSRKDLARMMHAPHEDTDDEPVYDGRCRPAGRSASPEIPSTGRNYRFRVSDGKTINFTDDNLGPQSFIAGKDFGDFLVWRKDGLP